LRWQPASFPEDGRGGRAGPGGGPGPGGRCEVGSHDHPREDRPEGHSDRDGVELDGRTRLRPGPARRRLTYIDTAEAYEQGRSERTIGDVLARTGKRKDVFLVTKAHAPRSISGDLKPAKYFGDFLSGSLERLQTDYVDSYFMHGVTGGQIPQLSDPSVKAVFENFKKAGKIKFAGLSCHDAMLVEVLEAAAKCGWIDHIMFQYNYRTMDADSLKRAVDKASKANIGLVEKYAGEYR